MKTITFTAPDINGGNKWVTRMPINGVELSDEELIDESRRLAIDGFKYYAKGDGVDMTADLDGMTYEIEGD